MRREHTKLSKAQRVDLLEEVIASERFLKKEGLGNEIPFFICPVVAHEGLTIDETVTQLENRLRKRAKPVSVLVINLYDLSIELLQARNIWTRLLENEASLGKPQLKELLQNVLDPETHLVPAIQAKMNAAEFDILILSGVGEVFPYVRSHSVLNNLQRVAKEKPTILFFPGEYAQSDVSGASLVLFGRLQGDKYYRAFNIYHFDV